MLNGNKISTIIKLYRIDNIATARFGPKNSGFSSNPKMVTIAENEEIRPNTMMLYIANFIAVYERLISYLFLIDLLKQIEKPLKKSFNEPDITIIIKVQANIGMKL